MDAVVVTGYQRIEKRKLTSSIANVKMADIAPRRRGERR